ncbi:hypothetical protein HJC99_00890 [Candidatus Saccharibacteria bacterium]|nr:hypothetical protein [Candidatus Saccharibacteria bacterium]
MKERHLITYQWILIGVLLVGFVAVSIISLNRSQAIEQAKAGHNGDIASLQEQLRQAKIPRPTTAPLQESVSNLASPSPSVTPTPVAKTK